jgi:acetylornithine deacetylase/succinyl-diaminopimelate desuccinylase-like protein
MTRKGSLKPGAVDAVDKVSWRPGLAYIRTMTDRIATLTTLTGDLVSIDSRSFVSNIPLADRIAAELGDFEVETLDYVEANGTAKRVLVAHRGGPGGIAFSGHMDTVPDTGWQEDPWSGRSEAGMLHGLGATDMKGPLAAAIMAARALPLRVPVSLFITTDEETTKHGARELVRRSALARAAKPAMILVVEPTKMIPVRGHRSHVLFTCVATGVQAHSATGLGRNANWALLPFLVEMQTLFDRLRTDPALQDRDYDPAFSDLNLVLDNHGAAINVTVPKATARLKFRYSAKIDPAPVLDVVYSAAKRAGVAVTEAREGLPPELPADHPLVRLCTDITGKQPGTVPFGTDASVLQALAPCVVMGPGDMGVAHAPGEAVSIAELDAAIPVFTHLAESIAERR